MNVEARRTYGGWRRTRGVGLFGLGAMQTLIVIGAVLVVIVSTVVGIGAVAVSAPIGAIAIGLTVIQWGGVSVAEGLIQRARFGSGVRRGHTRFRAGVLIDTDQPGWRLPGVLSATELLTVKPAGRAPYGVVWNRRLGTLTVTWRCAAQSTWLADTAAAETWVANWGAWMAGLGHQPMVRWVQVTVDTAPDMGSRLGDYIASRAVDTAPAAALRLLRQLVDAAPRVAADVQTLVSVTLDPNVSPARPRTLAASVEEVDRALHGLADGLATCGVTVLGLMSPHELAVTVRAAFDPAIRGDLARTSPQEVDWSTCGPIAADEFHDRYVHDSGVSVSWALQEAPRQPVTHNVLARLLGPGAYPKRVSLIYRPMSAGAAAREVESQVNAARFRANLRQARHLDPRARDMADHQQALQAAREEAAGAGLGLVTLAATVTVLQPDALAAAIADLESAADMCKVRLRRLWASQAAGFAATLPAGLCLPVLARQWPH